MEGQVQHVHTLESFISRDTVTSDSVPWVRDSDASVCMRCNGNFRYPFRPKHHCRKCGYVVCGACSRTRQIIDESKKPQRICNFCNDSDSKSENSFAPLDDQDLVDATPGESKTPVEAVTGMMPIRSHAKPWGTVYVRLVEAKGLIAQDVNLLGRKTNSDPYCLLKVDKSVEAKTRHVPQTLEPRWDVEVPFYVSSADPILHVQLMDHDHTNSDDELGSVMLSLGDLHESAEPFCGWLPLKPPSDQETSEAGAVKLEIRLGAFLSGPHLKAHVMPVPLPADGPPEFDIDAVYGPSMKIVDLLWRKFTSPLLFAFLDLIFWTRPRESLAVLISFNLGAYWFLAYWPSFFCLALAAYALSWRSVTTSEAAVVEAVPTASAVTGKKKMKRAATAPVGDSSSPANPATEDDSAEEEAHLGGFVQTLTMVTPTEYKELARFFQPLLRMAADVFQMIHDLFTWDHENSSKMVIGLVVMAVLCSVIHTSTLVMIVGSSMLLVCSPIYTAVVGLLAYARWKRLPADTMPGTWLFSVDYNSDWSSQEYRSQKQAGNSKSEGLGAKLRKAVSKVGGVNAMLAAGAHHTVDAAAEAHADVVA